MVPLILGNPPHILSSHGEKRQGLELGLSNPGFRLWGWEQLRRFALRTSNSRDTWGFTKIRGTILGVPILRSKVFGGLNLGPTILGNYHFPPRFLQWCSSAITVAYCFRFKTTELHSASQTLNAKRWLLTDWGLGLGVEGLGSRNPQTTRRAWNSFILCAFFLEEFQTFLTLDLNRACVAPQV